MHEKTSNTTHSSIKGPDELFILPWRKLAVAVLSLPLFGFAACVIWSILFQLEATTATHCRVKNYLPSTSAAIGNAPQKYVWRICIALHCTPRLMVALAYYNYHTCSIAKCGLHYRIFCAGATVLHLIENLALLFLTCISSLEEHDLHENLFIAFMVTSILYMTLTCGLFKWRRLQHEFSQEESRSFFYKKVTLAANILSFLLAVYFYFRHNSYCEAGIYTLFSMFEYLTILTNIAFHSTAILDFKVYTWFALCEYAIISTNVAFHSTVILDFTQSSLVLQSLRWKTTAMTTKRPRLAV